MPTIAPLLDAPLAVQIHASAAILAILLLPLTLFRRRKDRLHKTAGYIWVTAMVTAALSSFFIHDIRMIGPFSPIHLISVYLLFSVWQALSAAIRGDIITHQKAMTGLTIGALSIPGLLSLMPGRRMNDILFGDYSTEGFVLALTIAALAFARHFARKRRRVAAQK